MMHTMGEHIISESISQSNGIHPYWPNDLSTPPHLLDHRAMEWRNLMRARYWMDQSFEYTYPGPIQDLRQRLIIMPPNHYGDQTLTNYTLEVSTPLAHTSEEKDRFGNRILRINVPYVDQRVTFDMKMVVERDFSQSNWQQVAADQAKIFYDQTHLTQADQRILALAQNFQEQYAEPEAFGNAVNSWIYATMRYGRGATTVHTTAAQALEIGQGLCQDYAHIMLAICRSAGFAARYVSGHLLGEGRSHAWIELLIPNEQGHYRAIPFDPTNHRQTNPAYLTIAVGRDYTDVSPTSGTFTAPYPGQLHTTKRAGMTNIELR